MDRRLHELQQRQLGLLTRRQAHAAGLTDSTIETRLRNREWRLVRRGVYASSAVKPSAAQAVLAAALAVDAPARGSHLTAGALWGLRTPAPEGIHLLTAHDVRIRLPGVIHHRTKLLTPRDVGEVGGVEVTSVARTLVDCLPWLGTRQYGKAVDDARRRNLLRSYADLDRCHNAIDHGPRTGRHLVVPGRPVVTARAAGLRQAGGSERELDVLDTLERAGLPLPDQQVEVEIDGKRYVLDYAYAPEKIVVEWEGFSEHGLVYETFHGDRPRNNRLRLAGWLLLQFTAESTEDDVVRDVTAGLLARATMAG